MILNHLRQIRERFRFSLLVVFIEQQMAPSIPDRYMRMLLNTEHRAWFHPGIVYQHRGSKHKLTPGVPCGPTEKASMTARVKYLLENDRVHFADTLAEPYNQGKPFATDAQRQACLAQLVKNFTDQCGRWREEYKVTNPGPFQTVLKTYTGKGSGIAGRDDSFISFAMASRWAKEIRAMPEFEQQVRLFTETVA